VEVAELQHIGLALHHPSPFTTKYGHVTLPSPDWQNYAARRS
jgi:hypothetical protein